MKIKFWGARGSLPTPLTNEEYRSKLKGVLRQSRNASLETDEDVEAFVQGLPPHLSHTMGGNTTCYEVTSEGGTQVIIDMGTGIRSLGKTLMAGPCGQGKGHLRILMTHTHWDHIMGFPFFVPAYIPGNRIDFYGIHEHIEEALLMQSRPMCFPVHLTDMGAEFHFHTLQEGEPFQIGDLHITTKALEHPGTSYSYKFTEGDKTLIVATDAEYKKLTRPNLQPYLDFYEGADLLVFDAQYTLGEAFHKRDWGHSSPPIGIDIAYLADLKKLAFVHHDPNSDDKHLEDLAHAAQKYHENNYPDGNVAFVMVSEGMELSV